MLYLKGSNFYIYIYLNLPPYFPSYVHLHLHIVPFLDFDNRYIILIEEYLSLHRIDY